MTTAVTHALWLAGAYLLGSTPTSYMVARLGAGVDLREFGSRNLGATNLYRLLGLKAAIPVGLFDVAKGTVPVVLAQYGLNGGAVWPLLAGFAAVLGHVFSPFVRFRGGKGVATAAGAFLGLAPWSILVGLLVWAAVVSVTRYVSLGSMLAGAAFAASVPLLHPGSAAVNGAAVVIALFLVFTHRANLRRLLAGTETRIGRGGRAGGAGAGGEAA